MSSPVIDAKSTIFSKLFYTGKFEVPWYQRRYDWRKEQVSELLHDIDEAMREGRKCYFLGTIMLVEKGKRKQRWKINDGQQRMVTFSLICARLSRIFQEGSEQRYEGHALRVSFCLDENHTKRLSEADELEPRLTPPRNDKARYNLLIRGETIGTNGKLTEAWQLIDQFISGMELKECKKFMDFLLNKVEVACLYIPDAVDPNSVFETINCRGKPLDDLDLIRNYLYSYFNAEEQKPQRKTVYHNLESVREYLKYDKKATEYARCYFQCKYGFLRKDNFYRETRNKIRSMAGSISTKNKKSVGYIYDLVSEFSLSERVELFKVITNPSITDTDTNSFIQGFQTQSSTNNKKRNLLVFLKELQTYKITQPIVFALLNCYIKETDGGKKRGLAKRIHTNLKCVTSFVMRTAFVAPKFEPSHFESEFSDLAKNILSAKSLYDIKVMDVLKGCDSTYGIINDDRFIEK